MRIDERNGEDRFVRTKAGGVQGAKNHRNIVLFIPFLVCGTVFTSGQRRLRECLNVIRDEALCWYYLEMDYCWGHWCFYPVCQRTNLTVPPLIGFWQSERRTGSLHRLHKECKYLETAFLLMTSRGRCHWLQKEVRFYVSLWENEPNAHLISDLSKHFFNALMVSNASFKSCSQRNVLFVNYGQGMLYPP